MPFAPLARPSIQLGLLAELARSHGFPTRTLHLFLDFAADVGLERYHPLTDYRAAVGDWLFALEAFGPDTPGHDEDEFIGRFAADLTARTRGPGGSPPWTSADLRAARRNAVPRFLDAVVDTEDWAAVRVVGFTSTFQQNTASFALARRLKERFPRLITVFGGANFDGDMGREWVRSIDAVDYAVSGEGDVAFPRLLLALADGLDPVGTPGVLAVRNGRVVGGAATSLEELDDLPVPDYQDWFDRAERLGILSSGARRGVPLPFEGARGCWWGQRRHCTFCGLNGQTMRFRAKSGPRVVAELGELARRYRSFDFNAVDNIAAPTVLGDVVPELARTGATYRLFYEVKANLTRAELTALRDGGVRSIQPGIESLSSRVLGLMRKGTRASTNVNLLRWCRFLGIAVHWNVLWGFPGERTADYDEQARLVPHLAHLEPPGAASRLWMERFSPLFTDGDDFPARQLRPDASLEHVYPATVDLDRAAYFFDYELEGTLPDGAYGPLADAITGWQAAWRQDARPELRWWSAPGFLQIDDRRSPNGAGVHTFEEPLASLYLACSDAATKAAVARDAVGLACSVDEVAAALDEFCARGLMMRDGNLFLSLAIPAGGATDPRPDRDGTP